MWKETCEIVSRGRLQVEVGKPVYPYFLLGFSDENISHKTRDKTHNMFFHFSLWLKLNPDIMDFKVVADGAILESPVVEMTSQTIIILFEKENDSRKFSSWIDEYKTWFINEPMEKQAIPEFPRNGRHTISLVEDSTFSYNGIGGIGEDGGERWYWVLSNCRSPVYMLYGVGLGFANETEATHYKLRWS